MKTDAELMQDFKEGDIDAFEALVSRHHVGLYNFFARLHGNRAEAEDQTQEVFLKIYRSAESWMPTAKFTTWLYRIAKNAWIDWLRKRERRGVPKRLDGYGGDPDAPTLYDRLAAPADDPLDSLVSGENEDRIQAAVDALPEPLRLVFVLSETQGMKYADIGEALGIPEGTVKSRMHHAVRALRKMLPDLDPAA